MALRHRRADLLVLPFPLLYYGTLAGLKVNFTRNLMPLYPFLALAGSVGLLTAVECGMRNAECGIGFARRAIPSWHPPSLFRIPHSAFRIGLALLILPAALAGPTATAGRLDNLRAQTDARVAAQHWMQQHLSRGVYWLVQLPPQNTVFLTYRLLQGGRVVAGNVAELGGPQGGMHGVGQ